MAGRPWRERSSPVADDIEHLADRDAASISAVRARRNYFSYSEDSFRQPDHGHWLRVCGWIPGNRFGRKWDCRGGPAASQWRIDVEVEEVPGCVATWPWRGGLRDVL